MKLELHLHHFGISVESLEQTVTWYCDKLGFEPDYDYRMPQPNARVAFLKHGNFRVEIFEVTPSRDMPKTSEALETDLPIRGLKHLALAVSDVDDAKQQLEKRGVEFVGDVSTVPAPRGERFVFFQDNNGILIELYEPRGDKG